MIFSFSLFHLSNRKVSYGLLFFDLFAQSIILKGNTFCFAELYDDNMSLRHIKRAQLSLWYNEMKGHKDHIVKQILLLSNINCP